MRNVPHGAGFPRAYIGGETLILPTVTFNRPPEGVDVREMQRTWDALTSPYAVIELVDAVPVGDAWK